MADNVALVTGASRGIGEAVATKLAADGCRVAVAARSRDELARVAGTSGAFPVPVDVTDANAVAAAVRTVETELGPLTLLVNNAGTGGTGGPTWEKEPAAWWRVFEVNVLGAFLCARAVLPGMCARRSGRVVNIASNAAFFALEDDWDARIDSAYQASKAALVRLTEALAAETRTNGVQRVRDLARDGQDVDDRSRLRRHLGRPRSLDAPERTADLVAFLGSGALDDLSGRYIHAAIDDWETMPDRATAILADDLNTLRLRTPNS